MPLEETLRRAGFNLIRPSAKTAPHFTQLPMFDFFDYPRDLRAFANLEPQVTVLQSSNQYRIIPIQSVSTQAIRVREGWLKTFDESTSIKWQPFVH
jgi:hypothetical protein